MAKKWRLIAEIVLQMDVNWIEHNKNHSCLQKWLSLVSAYINAQIGCSKAGQYSDLAQKSLQTNLERTWGLLNRWNNRLNRKAMLIEHNGK